MPRPAQDRIGRGPFGALLILLSLLVGSGTFAAAGFDLRQSSTRLAPSRQAATAALLPSAIRNSSDEDKSGAGADASLPPSAPGLVTRRLWTRPLDAPSTRDEAVRPRPATASYRARAPPAA